MSNLFSMKRTLISEVVETELPEEQDQAMEVNLDSKGVMSIKMFAKTGDRMVSRIALRLNESRAVEVFTDTEGKFYQLRVDGGQVPVVFTPEQCEQFMTAVEKVLAKA